MNGPKLNRDWVGLRVKLNFDTANRFEKIPAGSCGIVDLYSRMGIRFEADPCEHCGIQVTITGMHRSSFTILTPRSEWADTQVKTRGRVGG